MGRSEHDMEKTLLRDAPDKEEKDVKEEKKEKKEGVCRRNTEQLQGNG